MPVVSVTVETSALLEPHAFSKQTFVALLLQVMRWSTYANTTPLQVRAIYEYSAIPPVKVAGLRASASNRCTKASSKVPES
jgi:hypothetical protein